MDALVREYLQASGSTAISITEGESGCGYITGIANAENANVLVTYWVPQKLAVKIASRARHALGLAAYRSEAEQHLRNAASAHCTNLTANGDAIGRAREAATELTRYLDLLEESGGLKVFNKRFKSLRIAAHERGDGFMSYDNAKLRLRRALIRRLNSPDPREIEPILDEVFSQSY